MKINELIGGLGKRIKGGAGEKWLIRLGISLCAFLFSNASVFGEYSPFGVSLAAAVPFPYVFFSFIGSTAGYLFFSPVTGSFRYIAACAAVIAIRWTLNDIKKLNSHSLYSSAVAFFPVLATGLAVMSVGGFTFQSIIIYSTEAMLGAAAAYFISRTSVILEGTRSIGMLTPQELASLILTGCILLLSFGGFRIYDLSVGRIAAILVILFSARNGSMTG